MRNKYPGICYRCGQMCEKGAGHFERYKGSFRVQHAECAIRWRNMKNETRTGLVDRGL